MPTSKKLTDAFRTLRKLGYVARQNVMCCSGCAQSELFNAIDTGVANGKRAPKGVVYYHGQDTECRDALKDFYLGYLPYEETRLTTEEVGQQVVQVLAQYGVQTEWNGDASTRIKVVAESLWAGEDWYPWHKCVQAEKAKCLN